MARIVITGGTGFIGSALAREMAGSGDEVIVPSRSPQRAWESLRGVATVVPFDGVSAADLAPHVDGAKAVVNLAGENIATGRWTAKKKTRIEASRMNAGQAVTAAVKRAGVKPEVVIQASAIGIYGDRGDEEIDESSPAGEGWMADVARRWEASTAGVEDQGVRRVVIRTGLVLGRGAGVLQKFLPSYRLYMGGPLGSGEQWFSWIHLRDQLRAIRHLVARKDLSGVFNLTSPDPRTMADFGKNLGRALGRPSWLPVPAFSLRLLFGQMADEVLLAGQQVLPRRLLESGFEFEFPELAAALSDLIG